MTCYRITRCRVPDVEAAISAVKVHRERLESAGARFIDIIEDGEGTAMVVACYSSREAMESATVVANHVFSELIRNGLVEGDSVEIFHGKTRFSVPATA